MESPETTLNMQMVDAMLATGLDVVTWDRNNVSELAFAAARAFTDWETREIFEKTDAQFEIWIKTMRTLRKMNRR